MVRVSVWDCACPPMRAETRCALAKCSTRSAALRSLHRHLLDTLQAAAAAAVVVAALAVVYARFLKWPTTRMAVMPNSHWLWGDSVAVQASNAEGRGPATWLGWLRRYGRDNLLAMRMPGFLFIMTD